MKSFVDIFSGIATHYEVWGSGPLPVVLLHGWGGSTESFYALATRLEATKKYTLFVVDVPGFGESSMPPHHGWGSHEYAGWLENFLAQKDILEAALLGHSNGGRIITRYMLWRKDNNPLILLGSAGIKWPLRPKQRIIKMASKIFGWVKKLVPQKIYGVVQRKVLKAHDWADCAQDLKPTLAKILAEEDMRPELMEKRLKNKVLLLWGANDTYTPLRSAKVLETCFEHSRLVVYNDGRHAIHRTHTDRIAREIEVFLDAQT